MANINDSFLVNLSQSVGISYDLKKNVLGSTTSPNSALFNVSQIASILTYGKPVFGVFEDADSFANMDFVNNIEQIEFQFSQGIVFYQRNKIVVPSQSIPVKNNVDYQGTKLFKFYLDYNDFNLASTIFSCTITAISSNIITVDQLPSVGYLNNFKTININNYLFGVASINSNTNTIVLNQDVSAYASTGFNANLIFQPVIKYITTFAANGTPPDIEVPSSGIILASATVNITGTSSLTYSCPLGVIALYESYPEYSNPASFFPNQQAYNAFLNSVNNSVKVYNTLQKYTIESNLVNSFITYTTNISSNSVGFDQYWRNQPFKPTVLFQYGLGFNGLQKTDFDSRFKDFYYYYKNVDLTRTFAIFRGDIFGGNALVGQSLGTFPGSTSVLNLVDFTGNSTIYNGTHAYGLSAVTSDGEYAPKVNSASNFYFDKKVNNYLSYTSPTISNLIFFHVYKNIKEQNGFQQQRLTDPFQLSGYTLNDTILPSLNSSFGISSSKFAFKIKDADAISGVIGGLAFNAFISDNSALTGIQSCLIVNAGSNYISPYAIISGNGYGAAISLSTSAGGGISSALVTSFGSGYTETPTITIFDAQTSSGGAGAQLFPIVSQLSCGIYSGTNYNPIEPEIYPLQSMPIASISSAYIMNLPVDNTNFVGLQSNTNYWAVFSMNTPYSLSASQKLKFIDTQGFTTYFATTNDFASFNTSITQSQIAKLGFLDQGSTGTVTSSRGVYLTNDKSAYPARVQIFVPYLDLSSMNFNDAGNNLTVLGQTYSSTSPIQNSMTVYVLAENSTTGYQTTLSGSVPQGTERGTTILIGNVDDLFDQVVDVFIEPDLTLGVNFVANTSIINWTIYDTITIDSVP